MCARPVSGASFSSGVVDQHTLGHIDCPACERAPDLTVARTSPDLPQTILFSEWMSIAEKYHQKHSSEAHAYDFGRKLVYLRKRFADTPANEMTRAVVQEWLDEMADEHEWGPASYNRYHSCFSSIFQLANEDNDDFFNPTTKIPRKREHGKERYWSDEEEQAIIAATATRFPSYEDIFILANEVGYRKSEQLRAKVGDYNPGTHKIAVHQRKNRSAGPIRYVPLSDRGIAAYDRLCGGRPVGAPLHLHREVRYQNGRTRSPEPMTDVRYWFDDVLEAAGINDSAASWHVCRHTFCSRLCAKGVPITDVQVYAGHTDIRTTMRYTHAIEGENDVRARAAMNAKKGVKSATIDDLQETIAALASQIAKLQTGIHLVERVA